MDSSEITFIFQFGSMRDVCTIPTHSLTLKTLKDSACDFINNKVPNNGLTHLSERVLLFRHDYNSANVLHIVNAASEILNETLLEIVITGSPTLLPTLYKPKLRSHQLNVQSYKVPTFCDFCGEMLFGLVRQGLKCDGCGQNYHKRCAVKVPSNCNRSDENSPENAATNDFTPDSIRIEQSQKESENFLNMNKNPLQLPSPSTSDLSGQTLSEQTGYNVEQHGPYMDKIFKPHLFEVHTYGVPTVCQYCKKLLKGLFKQGLQCRHCQYNAHKKCLDKVPECCLSEHHDYAESNLQTHGMPKGNVYKEEFNGSDLDNTADNRGTVQHFAGFDVNTERDFKHFFKTTRRTDECLSNDARLQKFKISDTPSSNIPLMRIVQSVKHTKKRSDEVLKEGWLVHFTCLDKTLRTHFWRLDSKTITLFVSDQGSKYYKEIHLHSIRSIEANENTTSGRNFCFELHTAEVIYYCGQDTSVDLSEDQALCQNGLGADIAKSWETSIKQAYMHVLNKQYCESEKNVHDMGQLYEIFSDEVLGSGQFGVVYGGVHKKSRRDVAIKVIDKLRFPTKQETQLKNEVAILQNISHCGVVNLERMFETPERIFVVMEKLKGDMLEMILSHERGRLSERVTKFLITQILIALKHLHSQNIVHCDLKPENVLLSSNSEFPQVKLCDFGYARIIGEKSFRRSVVGTPAYLAPEVLRNKCYNRSLDMWSVGVIIYVSLSGTFPFNEEEDINDQIQNAAFMYPPKPWKEISSTAIDLINNLLQVKQRKRYTVDKSLQHYWLQDKETYSDLRYLETQVGVRYLTHESDDIRWATTKEK